MRFKIITFLFIFKIIIPHGLFGQSYSYKQYSLEHGLTQSQVYVMKQDQFGNLWLGTIGGVSRFDGTKFYSLTTKDGLVNNAVTDLFEDSRGNMVLGTWKGLSVYTCEGSWNINTPIENGCKRTFINITKKEGLADDKINTLIEEAEGIYWVGTNAGLSRVVFDFSSNKKAPFSVKNYLIGDNSKPLSVQCLAISPKNELMIGTSHGLYREELNTSGFKAELVKPAGKNNLQEPIKVIVYDKNEICWIGTSQKIVQYDYANNQLSLFSEKFGLKEVEYNAIIQNSKGEMIFGTNGNGYFILNGDKLEHFSNTNGLATPFIKSLMEDRENNLWIGTDGEGLLMFTGKKFEIYNTKHGLSNNLILSIFQDVESNYWFGTHGSGINILSPSTNIIRTISEKEGLIGNKIYSITNDGYDNVWVGTNNGISIFKSTSPFSKPVNIDLIKSSANKIVYSILKDKNGNILAGTNHGLFKIEITQDKITNTLKFDMKDGLVGNTIRNMYEDKKGNVWLATDKGLAKLVNEKKDEKADTKPVFVNYSEKDGLENTLILSVTGDTYGNIWFGSYGGGVYMLNINNNNIINISTKAGLTSDNIVLLLMDDNNNLWIGSNLGVDKLNLNEYFQNNKIRVEHFGKLNGFAGVETNQNSSFKDKNGNLWFGTIGGAIKYNSVDNKPNVVKPLTNITNIKIFYESMLIPSNGVFNYDQNHISFEYAGVSLTVPEKVKYKYKLEGFDHEWSPETDVHFSTYSNLPPGIYSFKVIACNNDGLWNTIPTQYDFTIVAPLWRKWWFINGFAVLLILLLYGFIRYRVRKVERVNKILEDEVNIRTRQIKNQKKKLEKSYVDLAKEKVKGEHLAYLINNAEVDMIFVIDKEGNITETNELARKIFQYSAIEFNKMTLQNLIVFESRTMKWSYVFESILKDGNWRGEMIGTTKNQKTHNVEITISKPEVSPDGTENMICFLRDITRRKKIELELKNSNIRNSAMLRAIPDMMFRINPDGKFIDFKVFDEEKFNIKSEKNAFITNLNEVFSEYIVNQFLEHAKAALETRQIQYFESQIEAKKGIVDYEIRLVVSGQNEVLCMMRDISVRKKNEKELEKLSLVASKTDNAVIISNEDGLVEWVNEAYTKITGYEFNEVVGTLGASMLRKNNDGDVEFKKMLDKCKQTKEALVYEVENYKKSGEKIWVLTNLTPVFDEKDNFVNYVSLDIDITETKLAAEKLKKYSEELERSNEELQTFAFVASHDLKEPLRKVMTYSDRLIKSYRETVDDTGKHFFDRLRYSTNRMQKLIDDILTYSRVTTQAKPFEPVNLNEIINEVLGDLEVQLQEQKGKVYYKNLPTILADRSQIRQLFQNLISNALKFHFPDVQPEVKISCNDKSKKYYEIYIEDNGIGFDDKYVDKIFKPFQRLHTQNEYEGSGIGLAICNKIALRHGGQLTAKSKPGIGTKFIAKFPLQTENGKERN